MQAELTPPQDTLVPVPETAPVSVIKAEDLKGLGDKLSSLFTQYVSDRRVAELKWMRNLRQYLGQYDPEVERELGVNRSRAYPRITRVKCISVLSRVMNLMFPGNERNWELQASPSPDLSPQDVLTAMQKLADERMAKGIETPLSDADVEMVVMEIAQAKAEKLSTQIDDQLQELGGDQSLDHIALNRKVVQSGIMYGLGVLRGPFVTQTQKTKWGIDIKTGVPAARVTTQFKPMFEFLPVWDFYPDMSAKTLQSMDGYFIRVVMSRHQLRKLADRGDFFGDVIKKYLKTTGQQGNYKAQAFESELRTMGVKINVNEQKSETAKYEVIVWNGPVSGHFLQMAGVDVPEDRVADDLDAEVWMVDNNVIKADINPWRKINADVQTIHTFLFDEDDTSPIGNGLPNVMRDSQMSIAAASRMLLDNASVVCGPNVELNTDLLRLDQDLSSVHAYKVWYREGTGADAQQPAVRNIQIDSHMDELLKTIDLFMKFADMETFVGPATGGDMERGPSEPMRTAAGASMIRGDAALPFKDIIRNFDTFTQSYISSLVWFNRKFNPSPELEGDYNVIARGATSLIAKEVRGMQLDQLAATMTPEEKMHVDERKMVEQRFAVRDLSGMLVSPAEAERRKENAAAEAQKQAQQQEEMIAAEVRKTLAEAFKNVSQGQKNSANAEATQVQATLSILEKGLTSGQETRVDNAARSGTAESKQSRGTAGRKTA